MTPMAPFTAKNGVPGPNGGMTQFGSAQTAYLSPDPNFARTTLVPVYS